LINQFINLTIKAQTITDAFALSVAACCVCFKKS